MRHLYEPVCRASRAALYRQAAIDCFGAGYHTCAEVNYRMAAIFDPGGQRAYAEAHPEIADAYGWPRAEVVRRERRTTPVRNRGADPTRLDGRRDGPKLETLRVSPHMRAIHSKATRDRRTTRELVQGAA